MCPPENAFPDHSRELALVKNPQRRREQRQRRIPLRDLWRVEGRTSRLAVRQARPRKRLLGVPHRFRTERHFPTGPTAEPTPTPAATFSEPAANDRNIPIQKLGGCRCLAQPPLAPWHEPLPSP